MTSNPRVFSVLLLTVFILVSAHAVAGQGLSRYAPLSGSVSVNGVPDADAVTARAGVVRAVPVYTILPQTTPDSRFDALRLAAGVRSTAASTDVRFRATAMHIDIQRSPQNVLLDVLDVDRSGLSDLHVRWFRLGYGPAASYDGIRWQLSARVRLYGGRSTRKLGGAVFAGIPDARRTDSMWEAGLGLRTTLTRGTHGGLRIDASSEVHDAAGDLRMTQVTPSAFVRVSSSVRLDASVTVFRAERRGQTVSGAAPGLSVTYSRIP